MSTENRFKIAHCIKNCINLESDEQESSEDEDDFTFEESSEGSIESGK